MTFNRQLEVLYDGSWCSGWSTRRRDGCRTGRWVAAVRFQPDPHSVGRRMSKLDSWCTERADSSVPHQAHNSDVASEVARAVDAEGGNAGLTHTYQHFAEYPADRRAVVRLDVTHDFDDSYRALQQALSQR